MPKTKRPLSDKPSAVRARMRKTGKNITRDMEMLYKKPIEEWDMEELARGRPRNKSGNFTGPSPQWITPLVAKQATDRLRVLTKQELSVYAGDAVRVMHDLMTNEDTDMDGKPLVSPNVRLNAAQYVMDQIIGKPTTPVEVTGNVVLESLMARVLVNSDGTPAHPIVDAEVVEDELDEEEADEDGGD